LFGTTAWMKVEPEIADFAMFESSPPPGAAQAPHLHHAYDEAFYVLDGEMTFHLGGRSAVLGAGAVVFAPRGAPHGFAKSGPRPARMLVIATPGAVELVEALGKLAAGGPPDPRAVRALFAQHDSVFPVTG
jgi:mannose-6-phosphate isomerase-like protein (cupin superfamily)